MRLSTVRSRSKEAYLFNTAYCGYWIIGTVVSPIERPEFYWGMSGKENIINGVNICCFLENHMDSHLAFSLQQLRYKLIEVRRIGI
jgi:hypothetical protein